MRKDIMLSKNLVATMNDYHHPNVVKLRHKLKKEPFKDFKILNSESEVEKYASISGIYTFLCEAYSDASKYFEDGENNPDYRTTKAYNDKNEAEISFHMFKKILDALYFFDFEFNPNSNNHDKYASLVYYAKPFKPLSGSYVCLTFESPKNGFVLTVVKNKKHIYILL